MDPELVDRAQRIERIQSSYKALVGAARTPGKDAAGIRIRRELEAEQKGESSTART